MLNSDFDRREKFSGDFLNGLPYHHINIDVKKEQDLQEIFLMQQIL